MPPIKTKTRTKKKSSVKPRTKPAAKSRTKKKSSVKPRTKPAAKSRTKEKSSVKPRTSKSTSVTGECNPGYIRNEAGKCTQLPCFNSVTGEEIIGATRDVSGGCHLPVCRRGHLLNPSTGGCVSMTTPIGQSLLPYKYEVQARVARAKADRFSGLAPYASEGYGGMYKRSSEIRQIYREADASAQSNSDRIRLENKSRVVKKFEDSIAAMRARLGF